MVVTDEGTSQVKRAKTDLLRSQYENFAMNEEESIDDMITKFAKIINGLTSLGDAIDNEQKVRKVIRALPPSWEVKAISLKELNDKEEMKLIGLTAISRLMRWRGKQEKRRLHKRRRC